MSLYCVSYDSLLSGIFWQLIFYTLPPPCLNSCHVTGGNHFYDVGTKFFVVCEPGTLYMENLLKHIYELYTDYVLKNPFYEMEMPIRCELFDISLAQAVQKDRVALLGR